MENTRKKMVKAIEKLTDMIKDDIKSDDALKYTQAALNIAHVSQVLSNIKK